MIAVRVDEQVHPVTALRGGYIIGAFCKEVCVAAFNADLCDGKVVSAAVVFVGEAADVRLCVTVRRVARVIAEFGTDYIPLCPVSRNIYLLLTERRLIFARSLVVADVLHHLIIVVVVIKAFDRLYIA